jgi:D-inositol-3-phosphate glycosyltransferase
MRNAGRLLVPWYRYPPFSNERIGGLSVAVWELTAELARIGTRVDVLASEPVPRGTNVPPGVTVLASELGERFFKNQPLQTDQERALDGYDRILSIGNYAARTLNSCSRSRDRVVRQIHAIGQDRNVATYLSLKPSVVEYFKMVLAKRKDETNLRLLSGTKTLCVSEFVRSGMAEGLEDSRNLHMVPNGIQIRKFRPLQENKEYDLLFIGRFQRAKGLDILVEALKSISRRKSKTYTLAIVGPFSVRERTHILESISSAQKDRVVFLGTVMREALATVINRSKLVVVPSRYESFGLPALEAIACGVPVVAARVGGLPEIIDASVGALVEPNDHEALAHSIYELSEDHELSKRVAIAGPSRAQRYAWDHVALEVQTAIFA